MDELKLQRRPFQFSLRKALLWTAVWSAYLGIMRAMAVPLPVAVIVTMWFAILFAVRIKWGYKRGLYIVLSTAGLLVVPCIAVLALVGLSTVFGICPSVMNILIVLALGLFALGIVFGVPGLTCVHFVMRAVDWLDNLIQTKTPQDPG